MTVNNWRKEGETLEAFLESGNGAFVWTHQPASLEKGEKRTLRITHADVPSTDKRFFVGWKSIATPTKTRKVDIKVEARRSVVFDNVVTCAYGSGSNPRALRVEISEEHTTFTPACGKHGRLGLKSTIVTIARMKSDLVQEELHRHSPDVGDALVNDKRKGGGIRAADSPHGGLSIRRPKFYVGCLPKSEEQNKDAARGVGVAVEGPTATVTPC